MGTPWVIVAVIVLLAVAYVVLPAMIDAFLRFRDRRTVRCPETGLMASVSIDAKHAALTAIPGPPTLKVADCSLWPELHGCEETCVAHGTVR
jgi:hypothetical protein